jgi:hypothetical protein
MSIKVNYDLLDNKCFVNYLQFLCGRFFKILPISETEPSTLKDYIESLQLELIGNADLIEVLKHDAQFMSLIGTLQFLSNNECSHKVIRRETLKCTNIVQKLLQKYGGEYDEQNSRCK